MRLNLGLTQPAKKSQHCGNDEKNIVPILNLKSFGTIRYEKSKLNEKSWEKGKK